ncbi:MAG: hypothetical protein KF745_14085 [Phycisphaeraceae bacterium]|nr:hypothetical protein [Phycisphaeraceae bacterium]
MRHIYTLDMEFPRRSRHIARGILSEFPKLEIELNIEDSVIATAEDGAYIRRAYEEAHKRGMTCSLRVRTEYGREDALLGGLGLLHANSDCTATTIAPKDGFDFSGACPRCGMGAIQTKPCVLSPGARKYRQGNFLAVEESSRIIIRAEIGREIVKATKQPWCMRHPVTRSGEPIEDWMEPVPCATMPPLSRKSKGVMWGKSFGRTDIGQPAEAISPCPVCLREVQGDSQEEPVRLTYPQAAIDAAQKHAVVAMYEPKELFPRFDPIKRTYEHLYGLPQVLFNRAAIEVLMKHMQTEHIRDASWIQPVYSE